MIQLVKKVHIYTGLLTLAQLIVYGIAGLVATVQPSLERPKTPQSVRYVPFTVPPSSTDRQVADLVYRTVRPELSRPIPSSFLRRTPDRHLLLDFYNVNGILRVVVLEDQAKLRIEAIRNGVGLYLEDIHAATPGDRDSPGLVRVWGAWNEVAMWSLFGFCASGVWLWLASRPRFLWAWIALGSGAAALASFWAVFR